MRRQQQRGAAAGWLLLALLLLAAAMVLLLQDEVPPPTPPAAALPPARSAALVPASPLAWPVEPPASNAAAGTPPPVPSNDLADHAHRFPTDTAPRMSDVIAELRRRGVREGIAAFNPPGTKPILLGLAVPPDFALPPGFVRHHQTTDDGQDVEAVLRFHPDHRLYDAAGRPVPLPADLLVPPEWAPPGLPLRRVVPPLPASQAAG